MTKNAKKVSGFLIFAIILQILVPSFMDIVSANGNDFGEFITNISVLDKENGNPINGDISQDSSIFINYEFEINNENIKNLNENNTLKFPKGITKFSEGHRINERKNLDLDGYNIEFEVIIENGDYQIKFHGIEDLKSAASENEDDPIEFNIKGKFGFEYEFAEEEKQKENIQIDLIYAEGGTIEIEFEKEPESESNIYNLEKIGSLKDGNTIEWTIAYDIDLKEGDILTLTDEISKGHQYIGGSFKEVGNGQLDEYGTGWKYTIVGPFNGHKELKYETSIISSGEKLLENITRYSNKITPTINSIEFPGYVGVVDKVIVMKSGQEQETGSGIINWIVEIDATKDAEFKDEIPAGLELVEGSFKLDGRKISSSSGAPYISTTIPNTGRKQTITYQTRVVDKTIYDKNEGTSFTNKAVVILDGKDYSSSATVGVFSRLLAKYGNYNKATREVEWNVYINENKTNINETLFEDVFDENQSYVLDSFKINGVSYTDYGALEVEGNQIKFKFNEPIGERYINISYKTKVNNKAFTGINSKAKTSVSNMAENIVENNVKVGEYEYKGIVDVESEVITKENISYNYDSRELSWKIDVNQNKMEINNLVVKDYFGTAQEFLKESIRITDSNNLEFTNYTLKQDGENFSIEFNEVVRDKYTINYRTKIKEEFIKENLDKKELILDNKAMITGDEIVDGGVTVVVEKEIRNNTIDKKGFLKEDKQSIIWEVIINENNIDLGRVTLEDKLQKGLQLDQKSIKLYEHKVATNDTHLGKEIIEGFVSKYDPKTRVFSFAFDGDLNKSYVLRFKTDIVEKPEDVGFKNTIKFEGSDLLKHIESSMVVEFSEDDWSNISGELKRFGLIKIEKIDGEGNPLAGAEFGLYDDKGELIQTNISKEDGLVKFRKLELDKNYVVKEMVAPDGYKLSSEEFKFEIIKGNRIQRIEVMNIKEPVTPTDPEDPKDPEKPVTPTDPDKPVTPTDPTRPSRPNKPSRPKDPKDPETPIKPVIPIEPANPIKETEEEVPEKDPNVENDIPWDYEEEYMEIKDNIPKGGIILDDENIKNEKDILPKTGDNDKKILAIIGMFIILVGLGMLKKEK